MFYQAEVRSGNSCQASMIGGELKFHTPLCMAGYSELV